MLPDDWKDWQQCTDECLYVRLGLDPSRASSYSAGQIEAVYEERKLWWMKKPRCFTNCDSVMKMGSYVSLECGQGSLALLICQIKWQSQKLLNL